MLKCQRLPTERIQLRDIGKSPVSLRENPFPTFTETGFPKEVMDKFEKAIGRKTLGNISASGTAIINELGDEHVKTGYPIIYTSADSVFQIACHEDVIPVDELYKMCETAREILVGDYAVARVIARPFIGNGNGNYTRTERRKGFLSGSDFRNNPRPA